MMKSYRVMGIVLVASLVCFVGTVGADTANLVPNGDFTSDLSGWSMQAGWSWDDAGGSPFGPSARVAGNAWLYQPGVTTPPAFVEGQTYQLTFWAALLDGTNGSLRAGVSAPSGEYAPEFTALTSTWTEYSVSFTATAADVGQSFQPEFRGSAGATYGIDNVRFGAAPVPEPSSCVLLAAGLFGLLAYAWRKRR